MNLVIGCDHGGFLLKGILIEYLTKEGHAVRDFGCYSPESMDYPDMALPLAETVASGAYERGIVICTTGVGVSICANKVNGIRCALCTNVHMAEMTRRHNDANMLALGEQVLEPALAKEIVDAFLTTPFDGGERHVRRIGKIRAYEENR